MYSSYTVYKYLDPYRAMMNYVKSCLKDRPNLYFRILSRYLFHKIAHCISIAKDSKGVLCFFYFKSVLYPDIVGSCLEWKIVIKDGWVFFDKQLLTKFKNYLV